VKIQPRNRRLGILLSGRGSNFAAIADNIAMGMLEAEIAVVISNVESAPGLANARQRGLNCVCIPARGKAREAFDAEVVSALKQNDVGLVVLAGFMRIFSPVMLEAYPNLIVNIHPSLLPAFVGLEPQKQALEHGVKVSGCTVHIVNDALDAGPILFQTPVPVSNEDTAETLAARILKEEHRSYWRAIDLVLSGRCEIQGRRVVVRRNP
jgi:phosphoribosylglycinamide formyltransferase-1